MYETALPDTYAQRDITVPLLVLAIILLIIDILLRRFPEVIDRAAAVAAKLKPVRKKKPGFEERMKERKSQSSKNAEKSDKKEQEISDRTEKVSKDGVAKKSSASTLADFKRNRKK